VQCVEMPEVDWCPHCSSAMDASVQDVVEVWRCVDGACRCARPPRSSNLRHHLNSRRDPGTGGGTPVPWHGFALPLFVKIGPCEQGEKRQGISTVIVMKNINGKKWGDNENAPITIVPAFASFVHRVRRRTNQILVLGSDTCGDEGALAVWDPLRSDCHGQWIHSPAYGSDGSRSNSK